MSRFIRTVTISSPEHLSEATANTVYSATPSLGTERSISRDPFHSNEYQRPVTVTIAFRSKFQRKGYISVGAYHSEGLKTPDETVGVISPSTQSGVLRRSTLCPRHCQKASGSTIITPIRLIGPTLEEGTLEPIAGLPNDHPVNRPLFCGQPSTEGTVGERLAKGT
ncbi:hypothetical protein CC1G_01979 [Coprinopsis cinerea okayama7|uniref:Uncharacterized protein n=1 Tax=Coprinopsis cinerea (strain Okayama-7 / 130 / ATCC MYA-4618 / FGSC 9003) TaxID=240176 RepID=A8N664_COPC7|nr:hypothetical protein CC1G_01979 [Coprinopsis cinerea okayama7\|eukprot:XP_001830343.2 hypothetical protein CC1G_01979 [Coprinopsis cinerea okayama7\